MSTYIFDQAWSRELERHRSVEALWDEGTIAILAERVGPDATALELGAGGGSVARWLCDVVGSDGTVIAVDRDPRFLSADGRPNLTIAELDLDSHALEWIDLDLVHARLLLENLGHPAALLQEMVRVLRPGGWLVIEDFDFGLRLEHPQPPALASVDAALVADLRSMGGNPECGRQLLSWIASLDLEDRGAAGRAAVYSGGSPQAAARLLSLEARKHRLIQSGFVTSSEIDEAISALSSPSTTIISPLMVAAWGRKRRTPDDR